jgi:DNA-binding CsgD family transcriptional regulator/tetratricopeptide (TPR) repeat protein
MTPAAEAPFVGRERETAALLVAARAARAGAPGLVLLRGEAGIGKSRLAQRVEADLTALGFRVAAGGCVDIPGLRQARLPYGPFVEALRRLRGPGSAAPLSELIDGWLAPPPADRGAAGPARPGRDRPGEFLRLLERLTEQAPLAFVLEDLQWADRSSLALLVTVVRGLTRERFLIIGTVRTGGAAGRPGGTDLSSPATAALSHLGQLPVTRLVDLGPLSAAEQRDLVSLLAPAPLPAAAVDSILRRAEGNTLAACELATRHGEVGSTPPTLAASVHDRLHRCAPPARATLQAAAVIGRSMDHDLLRRLAAHPAAGSIDQALATGLLVAEGNGYRFRHGLHREVIYAGVPPGERRRLHAAVARALEREDTAGEPAERNARAAEHWLCSGHHEQARLASLAAARAAVAADAYPEALELYEHALGHRPVTAPDAAVLVEAAEVARWLGRSGRCDELLRQAVEIAATPGDRERAQQRLTWSRRFQEGTLPAARQAYERLGTERATATAARVAANYAAALMLHHHDVAACDLAREAVAAADACGADDARASALITLGVATARTGHPEDGLVVLRRGLEHARASAAREQWWRGLNNACVVLAGLGRLAEAADLVLDASVAAAGNGARLPPSAPAALGSGALALLDLGRWDQASGLLRLGLASCPDPVKAHDLHTVGAILNVLHGRLDVAALHLAECRALSAGTLSREAAADRHCIEAELAAARGDLAAARQHVDESIGSAEAADEPRLVIYALAVGLRVEADLGGAPGRRAPRRVADLAEILDRAALRCEPRLADVTVEVLLCRAELARYADDPAAAGAWRRLLERAVAAGRPYPQAYAQLHLATAELRAGNRAAATRSLTAAWTLAHRLGAHPLAAAAQAAALRSRVTLPPGTPDPPTPRAHTDAGLTPREVEVLRQLQSGQTNRQIARGLGISERTVSVHVSHLIGKLGVRNRGEAAAAAHQRKLLDPAG